MGFRKGRTKKQECAKSRCADWGDDGECLENDESIVDEVYVRKPSKTRLKKKNWEWLGAQGKAGGRPVLGKE